MMTKNQIRRRVVRFAVAKELFSSPLVGKSPLSASTRSQSHFGISMIKSGLAQLGSEIKAGSAMERYKCFLSARRHAVRTSLDGK